MVLVEDLRRRAHVEHVLGAHAPGQRDQPVEVVAHHGGLGRHRRHHLDLLELARRLLRGLRAHPGGLDARPQLVDLGLELVLLAEFLLDRLHLLDEVVLLLGLLHLLLDLAVDLALHEHDLDLGTEDEQQLFEPLAGAGGLEQGLLVLVLHHQVGAHGVGELVRLDDAGDGHEQLRGDLAAELDVLLELLVHRAAQRLGLAAAGLGARLDRLGPRREVVVLEPDADEAHALEPLDEDLHGVVRELEHLQDLGAHADVVEVLRQRVVDRGAPLRGQEDLLVGGHGALDRGDRLFAAHEERHHHVREDHDVAQRQQRQGAGAPAVRTGSLTTEPPFRDARIRFTTP